jgi:HlyD family secretion protein
MSAPVQPESRQPLEQVIARETHRSRRRTWVWVGGVLALAGASLATYLLTRARPTALAEQFELEQLDAGSVTREVVATGRVEARGAVEVGAEISGRVSSVEVDYDDHVEVGQVLLRFDSQTVDAQLAQAEASIAAAKSAVAQAEVSLADAKRHANQVHELHALGYESHENADAAKSALELARAQLASSRANLEAQQASYALARTQATKAVIESPISGVVISRAIDPGRTVAATFQTPVLFVIAEDLHRMEVVTPIDEADVGEVAVGQQASFTVDAYPDQRFAAVVTELHNEAKIVQNVVTYDAVLEVDNPELKLRPGMTASVRITTAEANDVLRVPNGALRFVPPGEAVDRTAGPGVWIIDGEQLRRVPVQIGVANGRYSELVSGALEPGQAVIIGLSELARSGAAAEDKP